MRWKKPQEPKAGDVRTRRLFAWKPKTIGDVVVWLEFYAIRERYYTPVGGNPGWWSHHETVTLDVYY